MSWSLNNVTTADQYVDRNSRQNLPAVSRLTIDVTNAAIYRQLQTVKSGGHGMGESGGSWDDEVFQLPGSKPIFRAAITGVRVRSAVAGKPAQVTVEAIDQ